MSKEMPKPVGESAMQSVAITTLGCKINQFESAAMQETLTKRGFRIVPFSERADVYIINTCTVTARTDSESRRLIRRAARQNGAARIVVTGCYAQVAAEELKDLPGVTLVVGNTEKKGIDLLLEATESEQTVHVSDIFREERAEALPLEIFAEHTRAFLQIQTGCNEYCAYCIVPYARGKSRSVPIADVLSGIDVFVAKGYREVVLTGIHLGAFGLDLEPRTNLLELLEAIERKRLVERLRLGSVEPQEMSGPLIDFFAASDRLCPHLHIPLQSGSDLVLGRMNRRYSTDLYRRLVEELVQRSPDVCLGADVITGFPGESEAEFVAGYRFIESLPLAYLHVFPFSARKGTPAAAMGNRVPDRVIRERVTALRTLSEAKKQAFAARFVGRELPVLFLGKGKNGLLNGLSRNYLQVAVEGSAALVNSEQPVRITAAKSGCVRGELLA
ncbi:MAG TPA: tRNA (N(6)-L-threonylcarbamoyladenosine(37)-C(2))-methylthiotransferase MtaB [Geobacteraceae bacterium]